MKNILKKLMRFGGMSKTNFPSPDARDKYLETTELGYLFSMFNLFMKVRDRPGHVVELGVGAGRNAILLGKMLKMVNQHGGSKYFGFDTFGSYTEKDLHAHPELSESKWSRNSRGFVESRIRSHGLDDVCHLIQGDIRETIPRFVEDAHVQKAKGSLSCRLIYIDTSAAEPARIGFDYLWELLTPGGMIAIDQRTQGGEWRAMNEFCMERGLEPRTDEFFYGVPAFIKKADLSENHD